MPRGICHAPAYPLLEGVGRDAAYYKNPPKRRELGMISDETNLVIAVKKAMENLPLEDRAGLADWMSTEVTKHDAGPTPIESEAEGTLLGSIKAAFTQLSAREKRSIIDWTP